MAYSAENYPLGERPRSRAFTYVFVVLAILAGITLRLYFALGMQSPGHGDLAYYFTLAKNLAEGRGFVIDYVWHFLIQPESLTHYSNDFWMPLTSIIICVFLIVFGESLLSALLPSIIFGLILSLIAYSIGMEYTRSRAIALWSAVVCLFAPSLFKYSLLTDSSIYYVVFAAACLLAIIKAKSRPGLYIAAAIFAGLAQLTRQDGLFLMLVLIFAIIASVDGGKVRLRLILFSLGAYLLVSSPLPVVNLMWAGKLFLSKTYKIAFVTTHDDIYSHAKNLSLTSYLSWGIGNIINSKMEAFWNNVIAIFQSFSRELVIIPILAFIRIIAPKIWRFRWNAYHPPLIFLALLFIFYTFVATFPAIGGAFFRSAMAFVPFGIVMAIEMLSKIVKRSVVFNMLMILIIGAAIAGSFRLAITTSGEINSQTHDLQAIAAAIANHNEATAEIIIMTRNPWELNAVTGFRAIQIPNNDLETIYEIALKYKANYLVLPAPREALEGIYSGEICDPRFEFIAAVAGANYKIFRIN